MSDEVTYRLRLARGFLDEAEQDLGIRRWRSCVDNSQLAAENAAKAVLASLAPVGRTHNPALQLRAALDRGEFAPGAAHFVELLARCAELLGPDIHAQSDYGDEAGGRTPWELFDEQAARQACQIARDAVAHSALLANEPVEPKAKPLDPQPD